MSENQLNPLVGSININLNEGPEGVSPSRRYMLGGNVSKSTTIKRPSTRRIITGVEKQYSRGVRRIEAPCDIKIDEIFYQENINDSGKDVDDWGEVYIVFYNEEKAKYDLLTFPKVNTQNTYIGFEYKYDKELMRKLKKGNTFKKGTVFGESPRISESGEWMFGTELMVCGMSHPATEEDGVVFSHSACEKMGVTFEEKRSFSWDEDEYIMLNLYGDLEHHKGFPENGERVREDGIVMGFRRKNDGVTTPLATETKKALMIPDRTYDILFYGNSGDIVKSVIVKTERNKNKSNNRKEVKISLPNTKLLESYEAANNAMNNKINKWYYSKLATYGNNLPLTPELTMFITQGIGNVNYNFSTNSYNSIKRINHYAKLKDWNIDITLKRALDTRILFKVTGMNGDKGVIVKVMPDDYMPYDEQSGRRAEICINNTPAYRRQIFTMLLNITINFYSLEIFDIIKDYYSKGELDKAYEELLKFYKTTSPEQYEVVINNFNDKEKQYDHLDYVIKDGKISIWRNHGSKIWGGDLARKLKETYPDINPRRVKYKNDMGIEVLTNEPIPISSIYYMLLDKFGTESSSTSIPKLTIFGMPANLSKADKYSSWHKDKQNRNLGESELRMCINQVGVTETIKRLCMGASPIVMSNMVRRIIRADNPFLIKQIVKPSEYCTNKSIQLGLNYLSDMGYGLTNSIGDELNGKDKA